MLSCSCSSLNSTIRNNIVITSDNKIVFLKLNFSKKDSLIHISQNNCEFAEGKLKDNYNRDTIAVQGFLVYSFLDNEQNVLKKIIIENPLEQNIEYVYSNNELSRKNIKKNDEIFILRFQYHENYEYLTIEILDENLVIKPIYKNKLICGEINEK